MRKKFPRLIFVVVFYAAFEIINRLWIAPIAFRLALGSNIFGVWVSVLQILMLAVSILAPVFIIYGILKIKKWGRTLTLVWFGFELVFNLFVLLAGAITKNVLVLNPLTATEFAFYIFIIVYCRHEKNFFQEQSTNSAQ